MYYGAYAQAGCARCFSAFFLRAAIFLLCLAPSSDAGFSLFFDIDGSLLKAFPTSFAAGNSSSPSGGTSAGTGGTPRDVRYIYYPVSGKTFSAIIRSAEENGPFNRNRTKRLPYHVDWSVGLTCQPAFTYTIDEENSKLHAAVEFRDMEFTDRITITLPSLLDDTSLNPVEQSLWKGYMEKLSEHTADIVSIVRDRASTEKASATLRETDYLIFDYAEGLDIEKTVEALLVQDATRAGKEWVREINRQITGYDETTSYGSRQERRNEFFDKLNK